MSRYDLFDSGSSDFFEVKFFGGILIIVITIFIAFTSCESNSASNTYNNGIHNDCGGHWVYQQSVGHKYDTSYIFKCDKCNAMTEIDSDYVTPIYFEDQSMAERNRIQRERENAEDAYATSADGEGDVEYEF